jgi:hypothetical protein
VTRLAVDRAVFLQDQAGGAKACPEWSEGWSPTR